MAPLVDLLAARGLSVGSDGVGLAEVMLLRSGEHLSSWVLPFSLLDSLIGERGVHILLALITTKTENKGRGCVILGASTI